VSGASSVARWVSAAVVSGAALFGIARASTAPLPVHDAGVARLRLSWSARPERIEVCRTLSAAELAEREEHMRQRVDCEGKFASYSLRIDADGRRLAESLERGAGLRHDRPLYVLREVDLTPGQHRIHVEFNRRERTDNDAAAFAAASSSGADTGLFAGRAQREAEERARRARAAIPPHLTLDTALTLGAGEVVVITLDQELRVLRLIGQASAR
jgi:hypothetical protein